MMDKLYWYLKQLLPLSYNTRFELADGTKCVSTWRCWFGKVFAIQTNTVDPHSGIEILKTQVTVVND